MSGSAKNPGRGDGAGGERRRGIGSSRARAEAARLRAVRIALAHDLVRAGRILDRRGMIVASEGNLSARVTADRVLITRSGRRKGDLTPRDFVELSLEEPADSPARLAASSEHRVHLVTYAARRDLDAVLHAHPVALTAYALRGHAPDFAKIDEARAFLGPVGFVPYQPAGTERLAEAVAAALETPIGAVRPTVVILQNHGALSVGANVDEALSRLEVAEHLAATLLLSERGGR
ncbi:MAG: class II aldolase/adducin family protein [Hyphomicrobiales bacterium]